MKTQAERDQAENMYVRDGFTLAEIAIKLNVSEKTVWNWSQEPTTPWADKRAAFIAAKKSFHEEQYLLARKVMKSIREDIEGGIEPSQTRVLLFKNLMMTIPKTKEYEESAAQATMDEQKEAKKSGVSAEAISQIEEQVFGLRR